MTEKAKTKAGSGDASAPEETKAKPSGRKTDAEAALEKAHNAKVGDDGMPKHDADDLAILKDGSKVTPPAEVETDPREAEENHADWFEGREPNDVVEVSGQRETVEARMARNGQASAEKAAGATTLSHG
jgi:hypothetical protein